MPVKVDPLIVEELAALDLVLWEAKHPKVAFFNEKTGKMSSREDKGWVIVSLAGPGVTENCLAGQSTLRRAVDTALRTYFADRVPGLKGAMLRLEAALWATERTIAESIYDPEDDIPF